MDVKLMACDVGTDASEETVMSELSSVETLELVRRPMRRRGERGGPMARVYPAGAVDVGVGSSRSGKEIRE